ncbi:MAG: FtsX-like permease family protein [Spirochaetes bacterium]|nr:FtsX-like permease family protein [Spirochaetota bacterium]
MRLLLKLAFRNLVRTPRKTFTIGILVAIGLCCMLVGNAVIDGSERGQRRMYIDGFTGDFAVGARTGELYSLFGNIDPVLAEYSETPVLPGAEAIKAILDSDPAVAGSAYQVSAAASVRWEGYKSTKPVFGVGSDYFRMLGSIKIVEGRAILDGESAIVITKAMADAAEKAGGHRPVPGDVFQLVSGSDTGFAIREVPLVGISEYAAPNATLDAITLVDLETARAMAAVTIGSAMGEPGGQAPSVLEGGIDDLFGTESAGSVASEGAGMDLQDIERQVAERTERPVGIAGGASHFILVRLVPGTDAKAWASRAARRIDETGYEAGIIDWRTAAGMSTLAVFALGIIFDAGFGIVAAGAVVIIMNSLVITALERTREIGTMRALGASRSFVSLLFMTETTMITSVFGVAGILAALVLSAVVGMHGIPMGNPLLVTLFGATELRPLVTPGLVASHVGLSVLMGAAASLYPVILIMRLAPTTALSAE